MKEKNLKKSIISASKKDASSILINSILEAMAEYYANENKEKKC